MSIVYSKEDSEQPVNYLNREIVLNPADVPEQLLAVLLTVRVSALAESQVHLNQVAQLQEAFEKVAMSILQGSVQGSTLDAPGDHKHGRLFTSDIVLSAHRGFTCTMTNFYYFLYTMNEKRLLPNQEELPQLQQDSGSLTSGNSASSNNSNSSSALKQSPLRVRITVEDTHGTKVLEDGSFRVDVRADRDEVYTLLRHGAKGIQEHVQQHRRMQQEINILSAEAVAELNLISITPAVGVSEEQLLEFLRRFTAYMKQSRVTKHALQQLHGLKVVAGHYLGVTDNGACVLPWELSLPEPIDSY